MIDFNIVVSVWFALFCAHVFAFLLGVLTAFIRGHYK